MARAHYSSANGRVTQLQSSSDVHICFASSGETVVIRRLVLNSFCEPVDESSKYAAGERPGA